MNCYAFNGFYSFYCSFIIRSGQFIEHSINRSIGQLQSKCKKAHKTKSKLMRHFSFKILSVRACEFFILHNNLHTHVIWMVCFAVELEVFDLKKPLFLFILKSETCIVPIWSQNENESVEVIQQDPHNETESYEKSLNYKSWPKWTPHYTIDCKIESVEKRSHIRMSLECRHSTHTDKLILILKLTCTE